jgi:hypothetical protein
MWHKESICTSQCKTFLLETETAREQLRNTKEEKVEEQLEMFRQFMKQREQLGFFGKT